MMPIKPILTIPDFMPLSAEQRAWLQGYYAGMAIQAEMSVAVGSGLSSFAVDILIGTQTGNAEGLAEDMAMTLGGAGAQSRLHQLDDAALDWQRRKRLLECAWLVVGRKELGE